MAKKISCSDVVPGCGFKAEASSEEELLKKVAKHAGEEHGLKEVTPDVLRKVKSSIREA